MPDEPIRVFLKKFGRFRYHIGSDPVSGFESECPYLVSQPFHAMWKPVITFPVTMPALVPFIHLDVFHSKRLQYTGSELSIKQNFFFCDTSIGIRPVSPAIDNGMYPRSL